jgi:hypothetical protein
MAATGTLHRSPLSQRRASRPSSDQGCYTQHTADTLRQARPRGATDRGATRHTRRSRPLSQTTTNHRAHLRQHQVPQTHRPVPTPRTTGMPSRMAAHHSDTQPPQARARHQASDSRLTSTTRRTASPPPTTFDTAHHKPDTSRHDFTRQPLRRGFFVEQRLGWRDVRTNCVPILWATTEGLTQQPWSAKLRR